MWPEGRIAPIWSSKSRCPKSVVELHLYHRRRLGRLRWLRSGSLLILFPSFPEAFQALPALRDIRDGPVELLGQQLTGCPLSGCKAAGHLLLSRHEALPGEFLGCLHRSEHEQEVREGIQERKTGQRKERPAGVRGAGRAGGSGESVFSEDVARHRFRFVLRRPVSPLSMMERGILAFLMPG